MFVFHVQWIQLPILVSLLPVILTWMQLWLHLGLCDSELPCNGPAPSIRGGPYNKTANYFQLQWLRRYQITLNPPKLLHICHAWTLRFQIQIIAGNCHYPIFHKESCVRRGWLIFSRVISAISCVSNRIWVNAQNGCGKRFSNLTVPCGDYITASIWRITTNICSSLMLIKHFILWKNILEEGGWLKTGQVEKRAILTKFPYVFGLNM